MSEAKSNQVGPYVLEKQLGAGNMGVVYYGRHSVMNVVHAVKLLKVDTREDPEMAQRFVREFQALAAVSAHPNVVTVHAAGQDGNRLYYAMELVQGEDLQERLRRGPLVPTSAVRFVLHTAKAVQALHEQGLIHRDIKPANIIVDEQGRAKLLDFGLAKVLLDTKSRLTLTGELIGTPLYMAPEQIVGGELGPWTDVYALGMTLYALLSGEPAIVMTTSMQVMADIVEAKHRPLRDVAPDAPPALADLCQRTFLADSTQRPALGELIEALEGYLTEGDQDQAAGDASRIAPWGWAVVVAALVISLSVWVLAGDGPRADEVSPSPTPSVTEPPPSPPSSGTPPRVEAYLEVARDMLEAEPRQAAVGFAKAYAALSEAGGSQDLLDEIEHQLRVAVARERVGLAKTVEAPGGAVRSLLLTPHGQLLAGRYEGRVQWFDTGDWSLGKEIEDLGNRVRGVDLAPNGRLLAVAVRDKVRILEIESQRVLNTLDGKGQHFRWCSFSGDGNHVVTCSASGEVGLWSVFEGAPIRVMRHTRGETGHGALGPDGVLVYSVGGDRTARVWDLRTGEQVVSLSTRSAPSGCALSPDGRLFAASLENGEVQLWQVGSWREVGLLQVSSHDLWRVIFAPDSQTIVTGCEEGEVSWWDVKGQKPLATFDTGTSDWIGSLVFSSDGKALIVGCETGPIQIYRLWRDGWEPPEIPGLVEDPVLATKRALDQ